MPPPGSRSATAATTTPDSGKMIAAFECVYGYRRAIPAGIKRIVAA